jgi:hypothetical protein
MSLPVTGTQAFHGDVGVDLRRRERSVTKQLLYATKVRAAVEKMSRSAVAQAMRPDRRRTVDPPHEVVDEFANSALVDPSAAVAEKECRA